jgi:hypothetical protein
MRKTREQMAKNPEATPWMAVFAEKLPEADMDSDESLLKETARHRKERLFAHSDSTYLRTAWFVEDRITSKWWFEAAVMVCIILVGVATGVDIEDNR